MAKKQNCVTSICADKSSYKLTTILLNELFDNAKKAKQEPYLELLIHIKNNEYYKLRCKVEKVKL